MASIELGLCPFMPPNCLSSIPCITIDFVSVETHCIKVRISKIVCLSVFLNCFCDVDPF